MTDSSPQNDDKMEAKTPTSTSHDLYSFLTTVIDAASRDPGQLRKLVYAMAWHSLKPDSVLSQQKPLELGPPNSFRELQEMIAFEHAVERIEGDAQTATAVSQTELSHSVSEETSLQQKSGPAIRPEVKCSFFQDFTSAEEIQNEPTAQPIDPT